MQTRRSRGFTLVELLVVIGIIAVLISLLLPMLHRAKEQANRVLCMSNHKQIMLGIAMYANDNKGKMPHCNWKGQQVAFRVPGWLFNAVSGSGLVGGQQAPTAIGEDTTPLFPETAARSGAVWRYLKNDKIFRCPFDTQPWNRGPVHSITSYGLNGSVNKFGGSHFFKMSQFRQNDILLWELDEYWTGGANIYNDGSNFPNEGITSRHGSRGLRDTNQGATRTESKAGAVVSTASLSTEWITVKEYYIEVNKAGTVDQPSRLWNVPRSASSNGR